jgi:signal transduction histidine kinase
VTTVPAATRQIASLPQRVVARVTAMPAQRRCLVQDGALGLIIAIVNVVSLLPYRSQLHPLWEPLLLVAAQGVLLTCRRRHPILVVIAIGFVRVYYDQAGFGYAPFPLGPAIAIYTVFDQCVAVWLWLTAIGCTVAVSVSLAAPGHSEPYQAIYQGAILLTAAVIGLLHRAARGNLAAAENRAARAEADLDRRARQEAAAERTRIARELHDVVAHHVSLMAVQSEAALSLLPDKPAKAERSVEVISETARAALTELRRLLGVLRSPSESRLETAPQASLGSLHELLSHVRNIGLKVDHEVIGTPVPLTPGVDLTAYRIVQEALTNTIRHSQAASARVTVRYEAGYVTVRVTDSGHRDRAAPASGPFGQGGAGLGLAGIAERVASCGGNLTLGPVPGGFLVEARLPA